MGQLFREIRILCAFSALLASCPGILAQEGTVEAYSREDLLHKIDMQTAYVLPEFAPSEVHYLDGSVTTAELNICAADNSVRFIASGADTMIVRNIGSVDFILASGRKFAVRDGMVLELLRESPSLSLAERKRLRLDEPRMEGSYGTVPPSSSARTTMADDYASTESRTYGYLVKIGYKVSYDYYLIDGEGDAGKASRKTFTEAFPALKDEIRATVRLRKIRFDDRDDVTYLYDYCSNETK